MADQSEDEQNGGITDAVLRKLKDHLGEESETQDSDAILELFEDQAHRHELARTVVNLLVPDMIDVNLWRDLAHGKNVHLPASDQYGPAATRHYPSAAGARGPGNLYGKVHSKGNQPPSAFMKRQGEFLSASARRIARAEEQLAALRQEHAEISHGLQLYAATALVTAMRKAVAPVFAMGPAWTVLESIQGPTGNEPSPKDQRVETQRILVVLHALRDNVEFRKALKTAILNVCHRYAGEAARSHPHPYDSRHNYEDILRNLDWPDL